MSLNKAELEKAKFCAELCHLVYDPDLKTNPNRVREVVAGIDVEKQFKYFNVDVCDTQAFVLEKNDLVYVVFQGTQSPVDWFYNFILKFKTVSGVGSYHTGFMTVSETSFQFVGEYLLAVLKRNPQSKVVLTGHSLGGAMATMYAYILQQEYPGVSIQSLVTFGQPRCGDKSFVGYLNSLNFDYKRFVNNGDYIADVPPPSEYGDWSHAGLGFVLTESELLLESINYERELLKRVINPIAGGIQLMLSKNFTKEERKKLSSDHDMPLYIQNLEKEIARK